MSTTMSYSRRPRSLHSIFFFQAEDGILDRNVTGVQTCALPILNLIIDLLTDSLGPAATTMVENFGLQLKVIDIGWPATAAISYGTVLGSLAIPHGIGVNILLLSTGLARTLNVDIWNYCHGASRGSLRCGGSWDCLLWLYDLVA